MRNERRCEESVSRPRTVHTVEGVAYYSRAYRTTSEATGMLVFQPFQASKAYPAC